MKEKGKLKVLGVLGKDNYSGSKFHRIELPLNSLNSKKVEINGEELEIDVQFYRQGQKGFEDLLKEVDVLYNGWLIGLNPGILGTLLTKHNVRYINDYDDSIILPENHRDYNPARIRTHLSQIILSDGIICATDRLGKFMAQFKEKDGEFYPVLINRNYLPDEGQFKYKPKVKRKGKIQVGIYGSQSHLNDWYSIQDVFRVLGKNKKFRDKCEFVICGYAPTHVGKAMKDIFKGINVKLNLIHSKDVYSYMDLLDNIDICLAPLENNEFNQSKSFLKALELSLRDIPMIGGDLYEDKGMECYIAKDTQEWVDTVLELIENDEYLQAGKEIGEINRSNNNWDKRLEDLKMMISYVLEKKDRPSDNVKAWGITYNADQYTEFENYFNQTKEKSWRFEYSPIIDIIDNKIGDYNGYVGVFSWKMPSKSGISKKILDAIVDDIIKTDNPDVLSLCPRIFQDNYLNFSYDQHPKLKEILVMVCNKLNLKLPEEVDKVIYSNMFIAKAEIYKKFVDEIVKPALDYMENEIWDIVNVDAEYQSGLPTEKLKEYTNLDYYNYVTFVLERMLSIWLYNNPQITFRNI